MSEEMPAYPDLAIGEQKMLPAYDHARWEPARRFFRFLLRTIGFTLLVRLERVEGIENIPASGPAIFMINHIAFVDPFIVLHLSPRSVVPMAKREVYDYPGVGWIPRLWGVIPVNREAMDRQAIRKALQVLEAGEMVLLAPEGTRSPQLQQAREGVAYLASRSGAPVVPVAIDGTEGFPALRFTRRWAGPGAVVRFGQPFRFRQELSRPNRQQLRQMTDEAMFILARMLPAHRRGVYAAADQAALETIERVG